MNCQKKEHNLTFEQAKKLVKRGWIEFRYHRNAELNEEKLEILDFREYNNVDS